MWKLKMITDSVAVAATHALDIKFHNCVIQIQFRVFLSPISAFKLNGKIYDRIPCRDAVDTIIYMFSRAR